jgi:MFS superfamily sulfate permease-like transporter
MAVVRSEYFPAGAVLVGVVLFWTIGLLGGLSWLSGGQPPLAILTWMIFIYGVVVLSPLAGILAAVDLARRWWRNRQARRQQHAAAAVETP